jgi:hypothetical protein
MEHLRNFPTSPWRTDGVWILNAVNQPVANAFREADARRIVAVLNACAAIPTWLLEGGLIAELVERHLEVDEEEEPSILST